MRKFGLLFVVLALMVMLIVPISAQDDLGTIVDIAVGNEDFSTLVAAVQAAGLVETLSGEGPFTVFAPTNDAFAAALEALGLTAEELLADVDTLTAVLTYHVVAGEVPAEVVVTLDGQSATTVQGEDVAISIVDGGVVLNGSVNVVATDIMASNGIIHVIDGVILPPSMTAPAEEEVAFGYIRVGHLSPDAPGVDVYINGEPSDIAGLEYPALTGWIQVPAGTYNIAVAPAGTSFDDAVIGPVDLTFAEASWTTIAAVGSVEGGTLTAQLISEDYNTALDSGSRVTVFHAIEDAPAVDVLANDAAAITLLGYPGTSGDNDGAFTIDVPAGTYDLQVVPSGATEPVVIDAPGVEFEGDTFYFIAAIGSLDAPNVLVEAVPLSAFDMMGDMGDDMGDMDGDAEAMDADMGDMDEDAEAMDEDMDEDAQAMDEDMGDMGTIVDIAAGNEDFSTLVAAVQAAGLVETLSGEGPFTVFAPTNDAFAAALEALGLTAEELLADTDTLTAILTYHVVAGEVPAEVVMTLDGQSATTVQGEDVAISIVDGGVVLNGSVNVVATDIMASNGIIHVIDGVILPPSFGG